MKQNIDKLQLFEIGATPDTFEKLGKLVRNDYVGMVKGYMLFDKLDSKTAVNMIADEICKDFSLGTMFEILDRDWFITLNPKGMDSQYDFQLEITERKDCKSADDYVIEEVYRGNELVDVLFNAIAEQYVELNFSKN